MAATLARSAELLILDEPFNGVDLLAREEIEKMILESMTEEKTVILSSHLVEEVESYIDFALFFRHGSLIATEDVEKMRQESGKSLTDLYRELLGGEGV